VYQEGDFNRNLCERIMEKVSLAINDMAVKSMDVFNRIQGARDILGRLRKLLNDSQRRGLTLAEIRTLSKIFKEVIEQANQF
jgi:flagellin-specific chaperone FliS